MILGIRAHCPSNRQFDFEVDTVLGQFAATAWVAFKPMSAIHSGLLAAHEAAGKKGLSDEDQRRRLVALGSTRNKITREREALMKFGYISKKGERWFATDQRPLEIDGKTVLVRVKFR